MLNTEIRVGNVLLKNRLVMPPMATEKSENGKVSQALIDYYDEKTKGGCIGMVVQEHAYISPEGQASKRQLSVADDDQIPELAKIPEIIHKNGSRIILQMSHAGSAAAKEMTGLDPISASAIPNMRGITKKAGGNANKAGMKGDAVQGPLAKEMSLTDIEIIRKKFAAAALRAKKAGYDGCEIHSAHGYLLNQFYSPLTNHRTDAYSGQTLDGRIKIHLEIIRAIRELVGNDFLLSMRLGACDYAHGGTKIQDSVYAAQKFEEAGLDMISISGGMCDYVNPTSTQPGWFSDASQAVKNAVGIPVLLTGGIQLPDDAVRLLLENKADLIGVGRAILRNSQWGQDILGKYS